MAEFTRSAEYLGVVISASYFLVYFWRMPIFILPPDILQANVATIFGSSLDLQNCFSLAYNFGFAAAKLPGTVLMTGAFFHRHRLGVISFLLISTMLVEGVGVLVFSSLPWLQTACVFISSFGSSLLYGGIFSYFEGRKATDSLIAIMTFSFILAGTASRGTARWVLELGCPPFLMPLAIGLVSCPLSVLLLGIADRAPACRPTAADIADRTERRPVTSQEQRSFMKRYCAGIVCFVLGYALITAIRGFRDFYSQAIFTTALGRDEPPSATFFFLVDVPGALLSCIVIYSFRRVRDCKKALMLMLAVMTSAMALMLVVTMWFGGRIKSGRIPSEGEGTVWCGLVGIAIYVAYGLYSGPTLDRLVAAARWDGSCTFLMFICDASGYVGTITLLLTQIFDTSGGDGDSSSISSGGSSNSNSSDHTRLPHLRVPLLFQQQQQRAQLELFVTFVYAACAAQILLLGSALLYFRARLPASQFSYNAHGMSAEGAGATTGGSADAIGTDDGSGSGGGGGGGMDGGSDSETRLLDPEGEGEGEGEGLQVRNPLGGVQGDEQAHRQGGRGGGGNIEVL